MAPPKKKRQLCKCSVRLVTTPIGTLRVTGCPHGLHSMKLEEDTVRAQPDARIAVALVSSDEDECSSEPDQSVSSCLDWLDAYFQNCKDVSNIKSPTICPCVCSTDGIFIEKVWLTLKEQVPLGSTVTYAALAKLAGNPTAARAVGSAMRRNPLMLLVPCHRVVRSNGTNGNYCGGKRNHIKDWLLHHESQL